MTESAGTWREVPFRKSSFSGSSGGNCVEIALTGARFALRDSKNAPGPVLAVAVEQGRAFLHAITKLMA